MPRNKTIKKNTPVHNVSKTAEDSIDFDFSKQTIKSLSSIVKILHESQIYLSKENDDFRSRIEKLEADNNMLLKKNLLNENMIKNLSKESSDLKFELNEIKQEKLESHFNINGLPEMPKEKSIEVVMKIADELDINLTPADIKVVSCFKNKKTNKVDYVFELHKSELKKEFIMKRKSRSIYANNNLDIFSVNSNPTINNNGARIFINDHLCQFNHHLLNHTKSLKNFDYKYVWYKFGKIFVKKNDSSEIIAIKSYQAVDDLIQKCQK